MSNYSITPDKTVAEIVSQDYRYARIFRDAGIDFCCGGNRPLVELCQENDLDTPAIVKKLNEISESTDSKPESFAKWPYEKLIDYIIEKHHAFAREQIPRIKMYANRVADVHGEKNPETREITRILDEMGGEMIRHMQKEELMLFPYITKLLHYEKTDEKPQRPIFNSVRKLIDSMEAEHEETGDHLSLVESLSNRFTPSQHACRTYIVLYKELEEFNEMTIEHIYLENHILFPEAIKLEDSALSN